MVHRGWNFVPGIRAFREGPALDSSSNVLLRCGVGRADIAQSLGASVLRYSTLNGVAAIAFTLPTTIFLTSCNSCMVAAVRSVIREGFTRSFSDSSADPYLEAVAALPF